MLLQQNRDYWSAVRHMPVHSVTTDLSISRKCVQLVWEYFHIHKNNEDKEDLEDDTITSNDDKDNQEGLTEKII